MTARVGSADMRPMAAESATPVRRWTAHPWRARTVRDLAEVWEAQGDETAARSARAEALGVFRELGCGGTPEPAAPE